MVMFGTSMLLQAAAGAAAADSGTLIASMGTGGELTLLAVLVVALAGGVVAMFAGDRVRRAEAARRPTMWGGEDGTR